MKNSTVFLVIILFLSSCITDHIEQQSDHWKIDISNLPVEVVTITDSDYDLKPAHGWDMHTDFQVNYTDNYNFDPEDNGKFIMKSNLFDILISGAIANSMANGLPMCKNKTKCDFSEFQPDGVWRNTGIKMASGEFEWEFINVKATKRFKVLVKNLPGQTEILDYDSIFSNKKDNNITVKKGHEGDSVSVQLLVFSKHILDSNTSGSSWGWKSLGINPEVDGNKLVIRQGDLLRSSISPNDTVFLNVATIKRFVNIIDNKDVGFTYQFNNLVPLRVDKEL